MKKKTDKIIELEATIESMSEDAVQNTTAFNLMLAANKSQAAEIAALKQALATISNATQSDCDGENWMKSIARAALKAGQ